MFVFFKAQKHTSIAPIFLTIPGNAKHEDIIFEKQKFFLCDVLNVLWHYAGSDVPAFGYHFRIICLEAC